MIPIAIREMVADYTSGHTDGMTKEGTRQQLVEIRDYLNGVLAGRCSVCNRLLGVTQ